MTKEAKAIADRADTVLAGFGLRIGRDPQDGRKTPGRDAYRHRVETASGNYSLFLDPRTHDDPQATRFGEVVAALQGAFAVVIPRGGGRGYSLTIDLGEPATPPPPQYRPYTGPAGPEQEQADENAAALAAAVPGCVTRSVTPLGCEGDGPELIAFNPATGRACVYDRWGFCACSPTGDFDFDEGDDLDQATFDDAAAYLRGDA